MLRNVNLHSCSGIRCHWNMHYTRTSVEWTWSLLVQLSICLQDSLSLYLQTISRLPLSMRQGYLLTLLRRLTRQLKMQWMSMWILEQHTYFTWEHHTSIHKICDWEWWLHMILSDVYTVPSALWLAIVSHKLHKVEACHVVWPRGKQKSRNTIVFTTQWNLAYGIQFRVFKYATLLNVRLTLYWKLCWGFVKEQ